MANDGPHIMFSVVIPAYNAEATICRALNSVVNQRFGDFEIIVVDDGSTDRTAERLTAYNDPRLSVITQENRGVSVARNRGVSEANAPWIAFLDADDSWAPTFLAAVHNAIQSWPDVEFFAAGYEIRNESGRLLRTSVRRNKPEVYLVRSYHWGRLTGTNHVMSSGCVISRDLFERSGGFHEGLVASEDLDFQSRVLYGRSFVHLNRPIACYNYSPLPQKVDRMFRSPDPFVHIRNMVCCLDSRTASALHRTGLWLLSVRTAAWLWYVVRTRRPEHKTRLRNILSKRPILRVTALLLRELRRRKWERTQDKPGTGTASG